ncbi:hypothetical protein [Candidatus Babela massiliensis]|uniref:Uncharacterized protein n=1 Tax=Candidatus Babela massiliensis TaxID=673862 RepID=V6DH83_9BACT|nr:hypothetical protein [Candidatus Babela massiliensis]CDK30957.1 hypothetical protein BABL1_gene_91 [Candidatus Babela massiliensis]
MLYRLYKILLITLITIKSIESNIVTSHILENNKTGQIILIYADRHGQKLNDFEKINEEKQTTTILKNIRELLNPADNTSTSILYEGPQYPEFIKQNIIESGESQFLFTLKDFDINFDNASKIINIDNRSFMYDSLFTYLQALEKADRYQGDKTFLFLNRPEFKKFKSLDKNALYNKFCKKILKAINKQKEIIDKLKHRLSPTLNNFIITQIETSLKALEIFNKTKNLNIIIPYTAVLLDINTILHIISNPQKQYIVFAGITHTNNIIKLLIEYLEFNQVYSSCTQQYELEALDETKAKLGTITEIDDKTLETKISYLYCDFPSEEDLNLINNAFAKYKNNSFKQLINRIKQEIKNKSNANTKWYTYSLEDLLEEMETINQKQEIKSDIIKYYKKYFYSIQKDFQIGKYKYLRCYDQKPLICPSIILQPNFWDYVLYPKITNSLNYVNMDNGIIALKKT